MADLREIAARWGLLAVALELLAGSKVHDDLESVPDPVALLDAIATAQVASPRAWRQDRILPMHERSSVLGGTIVAAEDQNCWVALLAEGSDSVEFVEEFRRERGGVFVVEYDRAGISMPITELLTRILVEEWVLAPPSRRQLRCDEADGGFEAHVLLEASGLGPLGGFPRLLAGPGWAGFGHGRSVHISLQDRGAAPPLELGSNWAELVSGPAVRDAFHAWDPWFADKVAAVDRWSSSTWVPIDSSHEQE